MLHVLANRIRVLEFHACKLYYHITQHSVLREPLTIINTLQLKTACCRNQLHRLEFDFHATESLHSSVITMYFKMICLNMTGPVHL